MTEGTQNLESFKCRHCEKLGEVSFSCFQKQQLLSKVRVWVNNLPDKLTDAGVRNLFLTVGKPVYINYNQGNHSALIEFKLMNEAELAVRDLHQKPPYHLKVIITKRKAPNVYDKRGDKDNETEAWDFSKPDISSEIEEEEPKRKPNEAIIEIRNKIKSLRYDPSVRMRQDALDVQFQTKFECVSKGRGYIFMGKTDQVVGGLQNYECTAEKSKAQDEITNLCNACNFLTTKECGRCTTPYCSKLCLDGCGVDHHKNCSVDSAVNLKFSTESSHKLLHLQLPIPLKSGAIVIMSAYLTMNTVVVRRVDKPWDEKFTKLCNNVTSEALKGKKLEKMPKVGNLVFARYKEDHCFYRAKVIALEKNKIILVFIDFGNIEEVDLDDLKPMPGYLKSVPYFAMRLHLKNVSDESSPDSVNYYNYLTADKVPLILKLEEETDDVLLIETDTDICVNDMVIKHSLPSWKKDKSVLSKLGEVFYRKISLETQKLETGVTCDLILSHFNEKEFLEWEVFWVTNPNTDTYLHVKSQMYFRIREYCQYLKNDAYLPRPNELCLAKEGGEWHRCANLSSQQTTCCLLFLDDGHSSYIQTKNIRKMIKDFIEAPAQAICCTLPVHPKLKEKKFLTKTMEYLKSRVGKKMESVRVVKLLGDAYGLSIPEINKILA